MERSPRRCTKRRMRSPLKRTALGRKAAGLAWWVKAAGTKTRTCLKQPLAPLTPHSEFDITISDYERRRQCIPSFVACHPAHSTFACAGRPPRLRNHAGSRPPVGGTVQTRARRSLRQSAETDEPGDGRERPQTVG